MNRLSPILAAAGLLAAAAAANAQKASLATFLEPNHPITRFQHTEFAEAVKKASGGKFVIEVFPGGALLPAAGTLQGVASGVAQIGIFPPSYTPSQFPNLNAIGDLGFLKPDSFVLPFAYADFIFNEKAGQDEWRRNGVVYGGGHATPIYQYLCKDVIRTHADLKGKKTRMPGGGWARVGAALGLTSVNLPASEIYTGLERGALDCICGDVTHLESGASIGALVKSIVKINLTPAFATAGLMYNQTFWKGLTTEQRRMLLDEGARTMVRLQMAYDREEKAAYEFARNKNIAVVEAEPALKKAYDDWIANGIGGAKQIAKDNYKVQDPDALFALFQKYIDKWDKLLAGVDRTSEAALYGVLMTNVFSKVDAAKYGME